jgi:hypothetical protein
VVREVRKLSETGRQTSPSSTNYRADYTSQAASMKLLPRDQEF